MHVGEETQLVCADHTYLHVLTARINDCLPSCFPQYEAFRRKPFAFLGRKDEFVSKITHIPPNLVVTTRASHNSFDLSIRYPHHVSSARMASDRGMRHGARRQTDTSQPHPHRRFPR